MFRRSARYRKSFRSHISIIVEVKSPIPTLKAAFRNMVKDSIGGLVTEAPPLISFNREKILSLAERHRIPAIHTFAGMD